MALYLPEKGTTEANKQRAESSLILQAARYQAKCEARIGMDQDIPLPHLDRSDHHLEYVPMLEPFRNTGIRPYQTGNQQQKLVSSLLELCTVFWDQLQTEANRGIAMDFPTRRLEHACIPIIQNRAEAVHFVFRRRSSFKKFKFEYWCPDIYANGSNKISFFTSFTSSAMSSVCLQSRGAWKKIMLPPLQSYPILCCILSSPLIDPNCALIFKALATIYALPLRAQVKRASRGVDLKIQAGKVELKEEEKRLTA
ncbi:hypothetical protein HYC85_028739 [Camellia sinensis]|uniref:Uncharacterized protein n=1 Tax=Camellia sinensis TaxID=4442 RepID=A0A7J7FYA9_CAMSI|nr:hypothetical protein HYC85_028739 [Camellia sinensis]